LSIPLIWLAVLKVFTMMYKISIEKENHIPVPEYEDKEVNLTQLHRLYLNYGTGASFQSYVSPLSLRLTSLYQKYMDNEFFEYNSVQPTGYVKYALRPRELENYFLPVRTPFAIFDVARTPSVSEFCSLTFESMYDFIQERTRFWMFPVIYLTPEFRVFLTDTGMMQKIRKCHTSEQFLNLLQTGGESYKPLPENQHWEEYRIDQIELDHAFAAYLRLLLSGDVELNPGPVCSKPINFGKPLNPANLQVGFDFVPNLLKGKVVHEHHIPLLEDFFRSRAVHELIDGATVVGGVTADMADRIKTRTVSMCTVIYNLCRWTQNKLSTPDLIVNLTSSLICAVPVTMIRNAFTSLFGTAIVQAGSDDVGEILRLVLKAILMAVFLLTAQKLPGKHTCDEFINRVYSIPRAMSGVESFWSKMDPIVEKATDFIDEKVFGSDLSAAQAVYIQAVQDWADEVAEMSKLYKRKRITTDIQTMEAAGKLHVKGIRLLARCTKLGYDRKNAELIRSLLQTTYKISEAAMRSGADKCRVRRAPLIVWFTGNSGVGKSTFTYPFILDCMKAEGVSTKNWESRIYARAPETEFWDGYLDQEYIIYDDAFQLKDSQANPSPELFEIIRLGNMFPYMLHMAGMEEKGNTFGCPKLVCMSSNLDTIKAESIWCKEAVARRIDFAYRTTLKEKYRKYYTSNGQRLYMLDTTKVSQEQAIDLDIYQYQRFDPHTGENIDEPIDYKTMARIVGQELKKRAQNYASYDTFLKEYASRPLPRNNLRFTDDDPTVFSDDETPQLQIGNPESGTYWSNIHNGRAIIPDLTRTAAVLPGYKKSRWLNSTKFYTAARWVCWDLPVLAYGGLARNVDIINKCTPQRVLEYCNNKSDDYKYNFEGCEYYLDKDYDFEQKMLPKFSETITDREASLVERAIATYKNWHHKYFKPAYYKVRFNLPGMVVKVIGLLVAFRFFKNLYRSFFPKKQTLYELIDEMRESIDKAEKCFKTGNCLNCKTCKNAPPTIVDDFYYWGVPCACYVYACRTQTDRNKRIFMAYANAKLNPRKITNRPIIQHRMFDFANSCDCEKCPLCTSDVCECRKVAIDRGCDIGEHDLVDRVGLEDLWESPVFQNNDHQGSPTSARISRARVQNLDHQGKLNSKQPPRAIVQNLDHQGKPNTKVNYRAKVQSLSPERVKLRPEAQYNRAAMFDMQADGVANRLWPNLFRIYVTERNDEAVVRHLGHVLCIKGSVFLMNWHFKLVLEEYPEYDVVMRNNKGLLYKRIPASDFIQTCVRIGEKDACVVALDDKGVNMASLLQHFQPKAAKYSHDVQTMQILRYKVDSYGMIRCPIVLQDATLISEPVEVEMTKRASTEKVVLINPMSWWYTAATEFGDCGAPLMILNSQTPTKIVGIHNAAILKSGNAFGVPIYREELETALTSLPIALQFAWEEPQVLETVAFDEFNDGDNFVVVKAEKGSVPAPVTTKLRKSPIHGNLIPTLTKPGYLRPFVNKDGVRIDPPVLNRRKWGYDQPRINNQIGERCTNAIIQLLCKKTARDSPYYHVPLSTDEAIQGIDGVEGLNSINKTSSPGYPYVFDKKKGRGKTGYFGDFEFDPTLPGYGEVVEDILELERKYRDNVRPFIVWIDTMKDARIPIVKADMGKTRIFSAGPMHYCILYRKYFLPFFAHCMNNRIDNMMAPGINPVSPEWHKLATKLKQKGKDVIAGDYSNYDGKACTEGYKACYEAAIEWYMIHWNEIVSQGKNVIQGVELDREQFAQFLRNIAFECTTHVHLCEKEFEQNGQMEKYRVYYQVMNGMPSGNPGTAITNSVCGIWMVMYCYFIVFAEDSELCTIEMFFYLVYLITYGDDVCINIHHSIIDRFNQEVLTIVMKQCFGIDFTDEQKTGAIVKSRTLPEVSFLKRRFEYNQYLQMYVAPMPEDVLLDISNWVRSGKEDPAVITVNNLKSIMSEISFISKEKFNYWKPLIQEQARLLTKNTSITPIFDTYTGYLDLYRQGKLIAVEAF
jgi:hypothetical protein